jgi:anti-sigma factor RsiW
MKITRDVIQDLLPLYISGEASADTLSLVREYLERDPELAEKVEKAQANDLSEVPVPLSKETQMKAYQKSRIILYVTIVALALLMAAILGVILIAFFIPA